MNKETIKKLGQDMIDEGRWSEFYQKGDHRGNGKDLYMYSYHHNNYMRLQRELAAARK